MAVFDRHLQFLPARGDVVALELLPDFVLKDLIVDVRHFPTVLEWENEGVRSLTPWITSVWREPSLDWQRDAEQRRFSQEDQNERHRPCLSRVSDTTL